MTFLVKKLDKSLNKKDFVCGEEALDIYLKTYASQDDKKNISRTFCLYEGSVIKGYYSIASGSILLDRLPDHMAKKLPSFSIPIARLCRLAVNRSEQGKGYGEFLLVDALRRILSASDIMGLFAVVVDAKHEKAKEFYEQYGFISLVDDPLTLIRSVKSIQRELP